MVTSEVERAREEDLDVENRGMFVIKHATAESGWEKTSVKVGLRGLPKPGVQYDTEQLSTASESDLSFLKRDVELFRRYIERVTADVEQKAERMSEAVARLRVTSSMVPPGADRVIKALSAGVADIVSFLTSGMLAESKLQSRIDNDARDFAFFDAGGKIFAHMQEAPEFQGEQQFGEIRLEIRDMIIELEQLCLRQRTALRLRGNSRVKAYNHIFDEEPQWRDPGIQFSYITGSSTIPK